MTEIVFDGEIRGRLAGKYRKRQENTAEKPFFYCNFLKGTCGNFTAVSRMIERRAILRQWRENDGNIMKITTGAAEKQPLPFVDL